jgi:hypothetical protein
MSVVLSGCRKLYFFQALHGTIDERLALFRIFLNAVLLGDDRIAVHFQTVLGVQH